MVLFSIRKISKDNRTRWSRSVLRRRTGAHNVCWESIPGRIGPQAWTGCWRKLILLA